MTSSKVVARESVHWLCSMMGGDVQRGRALAFLAANPERTVEEVVERMSLPKSTAYKLINDFVAAHLILKAGVEDRKAKFSVVPFEVKSKIRVGDRVIAVTMTPKNVKVYAAQNQPAARFFIERHGFKKFVRFAGLYEKHEEGKMPIFLMAKDLGVTEFEIASMISEIDDFIRPSK